VVGAVRRREAEFGINILGPHDPDLTSIPILRDRFVLVCREDHPLARRKRLAWKQLEAHPLIFAGHEGAYPSLRTIPLVGPQVSRTMVLLARRKAYLAPAAQALYDLIRRQHRPPAFAALSTR
jgi:DNA-binding transcriptional LysR family regulator